jgi:hypothetical protein
MTEQNLKWLPTSEGWKIPGLALFKMEYGRGEIRMCATALAKRILVIDTESGLWGITPSDVKGFVSAVENRRSK